MSVSARPARITRDPEGSRTKILDHARREFVAHGLNGARVDRIAEQAGINKNLIYHYFGSKEGLYLEVLERIYIALRADQHDEHLRDLPPLEGMRKLIANTFDHFVATPDLIRLMSIENIHCAQYLKQSARVKPLYADLLDTLRILLENGQRDGVFRANVDAVDLYLSISGLAYFFLSNQHTLSWLLDRSFVSKPRLKQRREHVVEMVLSYLTQPATPADTNSSIRSVFVSTQRESRK
ncbi:MAG: TetR/AcrR family transcriptional regulator [Hyphomicrobiaceae bacterium]